MNNNNNDNDNDNCDSFIKKCQDCYQKHYNGGGNNNNNNDNNNNLIIENPSMNNKYKKCWISTLKVRRCQAFIKCKNEAFNYYKSPSDNNNHLNGGGGPKDKGICSAYDESYCFGNPQIMKIDLLVEINKSTNSNSNNNNIKIIEQRQKQRQDIFNHHEKAKRRVIASKNKQSQCNEIRTKLNNCLRNK